MEVRELIKVEVNDKQEVVVSGREIHREEGIRNGTDHPDQKLQFYCKTTEDQLMADLFLFTFIKHLFFKIKAKLKKILYFFIVKPKSWVYILIGS